MVSYSSGNKYDYVTTSEAILYNYLRAIQIVVVIYCHLGHFMLLGWLVTRSSGKITCQFLEDMSPLKKNMSNKKKQFQPFFAPRVCWKKKPGLETNTTESTAPTGYTPGSLTASLPPDKMVGKEGRRSGFLLGFGNFSGENSLLNFRGVMFPKNFGPIFLWSTPPDLGISHFGPAHRGQDETQQHECQQNGSWNIRRHKIAMKFTSILVAVSKMEGQRNFLLAKMRNTISWLGCHIYYTPLKLTVRPWK